MNRTDISKNAKDANAGAIVVMDVNTGEVLAMASYPYFNPEEWIGGISLDTWNSYISKESNNPILNRAIASEYAPGSTFKMVTAVAALETGNVTVDEKINDVGIYPRGHNPTCWIYPLHHRGHGYLNITDAIKHSCNYFFYEMGYRIGIETLDRYASSFGLGTKTGIELTGERSGILASREMAAEKGEVWTVRVYIICGYTVSYIIALHHCKWQNI